jgi:hypothetical protein
MHRLLCDCAENVKLSRDEKSACLDVLIVAADKDPFLIFSEQTCYQWVLVTQGILSVDLSDQVAALWRRKVTLELLESWGRNISVLLRMSSHELNERERLGGSLEEVRDLLAETVCIHRISGLALLGVASNIGLVDGLADGGKRFIKQLALVQCAYFSNAPDIFTNERDAVWVIIHSVAARPAVNKAFPELRSECVAHWIGKMFDTGIESSIQIANQVFERAMRAGWFSGYKDTLISVKNKQTASIKSQFPQGLRE